jgi:shikimate 5-dehydrogenase
MKTFISLSNYPGSTGKYFYNKFFEYYSIDAEYIPKKSVNLKEDLEKAILDNVSGISLSMPFKQEVLSYLDKKTANVEIYGTCNTVKLENDLLVGYNADINGLYQISKFIKPTDRITILGIGAMGQMFISYLEESHYGNLNICARSLGTWDNRHAASDVIVNCTAFGTATIDSPLDFIPPNANLVIDLAIKNNNLEQQCIHNRTKYISGKEFYKFQFLQQFEIYTGIGPDTIAYDRFEQELYEQI